MKHEQRFALRGEGARADSFTGNRSGGTGKARSAS
jgi:hypothetical protein